MHAGPARRAGVGLGARAHRRELGRAGGRWGAGARGAGARGAWACGARGLAGAAGARGARGRQAGARAAGARRALGAGCRRAACAHLGVLAGLWAVHLVHSACFDPVLTQYCF